MFYVRIDKNRKLPITCLIRALGLKTDAEILELFGEDPLITATLEKDTCKTYEEAMLEIYRRLRPGEPPTVDNAETLINNLFFDPRRYDLSAVGRYKFNKKLDIWSRLAGHELAEPIADPFTGEILAEAGEVLTRERGPELENHGVNEAVLRLLQRHGRHVPLRGLRSEGSGRQGEGPRRHPAAAAGAVRRGELRRTEGGARRGSRRTT